MSMLPADTHRRLGARPHLVPTGEAALAGRAPDVAALEEVIRAGLALTYHCTRVWEAWNVGTMSQDDFEPVDESGTPRELAESVLDLLSASKTSSAPAPRDTAAMLSEHKLLVTEVGAAGWACNSARLRAAELAVEASARKLLGEA